jgi:hypothetical protein
VAVRNAGAKPLAFRGATVATRHVGRSPCLVDEDEALRIEIELAVEPVFAPLQDVRAVLLARVGGLFFERQSAALEEGP